MKNKNILLLIVVALMITSFVNPAYGEGEDKLYVIPIKGEITKASYNFVRKHLEEAERQNVDSIIFEIDTYGGLVDEAIKIKDLILEASDQGILTIAYINNKAESAGVLIALANEKIVMNTWATIGSAETIPNNEKLLSMWRGILRDTAQLRGRDEKIVQAMADKDLVVEGLNSPGKLVNLTSQEALERGIADLSANSLEDIRQELGLEASIYRVEESMALGLAKYISNPYISSLLLSMGFLGLVIEVLTAGFGVGASIAITGFGLYFGGNILAGYGRLTSLIIFLTGIILVTIEVIVPGFGLPGISGIILLITGIILATDSLAISMASLAIGLLIAIFAGIMLMKWGKKKGRMKGVVLESKLDRDRGYVSSANKDEYLNKEGHSLSNLRPSGFIEIDGEKLDALSEDGLIEKDKKIIVTRVEGSKIFVRRM